LRNLRGLWLAAKSTMSKHALPGPGYSWWIPSVLDPGTSVSRPYPGPRYTPAPGTPRTRVNFGSRYTRGPGVHGAWLAVACAEAVGRTAPPFRWGRWPHLAWRAQPQRSPRMPSLVQPVTTICSSGPNVCPWVRSDKGWTSSNKGAGPGGALILVLVHTLSLRVGARRGLCRTSSHELYGTH
jgi:hypothetical protein